MFNNAMFNKKNREGTLSGGAAGILGRAGAGARTLGGDEGAQEEAEEEVHEVMMEEATGRNADEIEVRAGLADMLLSMG